MRLFFRGIFRDIFRAILLSIVATMLFIDSFSFTNAETAFTDIENSPFKASIEYLAERGIVKGYSDGTFRPKAKMNRAEFTVIITQSFASDKEIGTGKNCFTDVSDQWFARFICFAQMEKLISGYPDGYFRPGKSVSFVEALVIGLKGAQIKIESPEVSGTMASGTTTATSQWYTPSFEFAHRNNIFSKYALLPGAELTREKAAFIIHQILLIENGEKAVATKRQNFSTGCGEIPLQTAPTTTTIDEVKRNFITVIPASYEKNTPIKLVFAFHGRTNSNADVRGYYKVEQAAAGKAIFIYPSGLKSESGSGYTWGSTGDFKFFDTLLQTFSESYCIDLDHIYVVGHSLGGWFTSQLGCARGDVIRGIANIGGGASLQKSCAGPVAAMIWHNPKDNLVSYAQGKIARDQAKQQNQCSEKTKPASPTWANCVAYQGCAETNPLFWCPHNEDYAYWSGGYYPHTWPKEAGAEIWKFFMGLPG